MNDNDKMLKTNKADLRLYRCCTVLAIIAQSRTIKVAKVICSPLSKEYSSDL